MIRLYILLVSKNAELLKSIDSSINPDNIKGIVSLSVKLLPLPELSVKSPSNLKWAIKLVLSSIGIAVTNEW